MRVPRLIATDLDGTLLDPDGRVSPRAGKALDAAAAAGIAVVLVTGRPLRWLAEVYDQLDTAYPVICANGAVDYDPGLDVVHATWPIPPTVVAQTCSRLASAIPGIAFAAEIEDGRGMVREPAYPVVWAEEADASEVPLAELIRYPTVKLVARGGRLDLDRFGAVATATVDGLVHVTHSSADGPVEMSATGVTKATGLAGLAGRLGIDAVDVLAFGDMPNDVPMLRWAGRGIAVANAHPAARAAADDVTLSNVDDGVAEYLEDLLGDG